MFGYMLFSRSGVPPEDRNTMRELCSRSESAKLRRLLDELSLEPSSYARLRLFVLEGIPVGNVSEIQNSDRL